eukprot:jgi/Chlat1/8596/Chrsp86S09233
MELRTASTLLLCACLALLSCTIHSAAAASVTLKSLVIYNKHESFGRPEIYFECLGNTTEARAMLDDVQKEGVVYNFTADASWQPAVKNLSEGQCITCGFFEKDLLKSDDQLGTFELCYNTFAYLNKDTGIPNKALIKSVPTEFDAVFECGNCTFSSDSSQASSGGTQTGDSKADEQFHKGHGAIFVLFIVMASIAGGFALGVGAVKLYKHQQKRRKLKQMQQFEMLFVEDGHHIYGLDDADEIL